MYAGLLYTKGDYTVIMDADLQHPPEVISDMYREISSGQYDMIATRRKNRKTDTKMRASLSHMFYGFMNRISGINMECDGFQDVQPKGQKCDSINYRI